MQNQRGKKGSSRIELPCETSCLIWAAFHSVSLAETPVPLVKDVPPAAPGFRGSWDVI